MSLIELLQTRRARVVCASALACAAALGGIAVLGSTGRSTNPKSTRPSAEASLRSYPDHALLDSAVNVGTVAGGDRIPLLSISDDSTSVSVEMLDLDEESTVRLPPLPPQPTGTWIASGSTIASSDWVIASLTRCTARPVEGDGSDACPTGAGHASALYVIPSGVGSPWRIVEDERLGDLIAPALMHVSGNSLELRGFDASGAPRELRLELNGGSLEDRGPQVDASVCAITSEPRAEFSSSEGPVTVEVPATDAKSVVELPREIGDRLLPGIESSLRCASAGRFLAVFASDPPAADQPSTELELPPLVDPEEGGSTTADSASLPASSADHLVYDLLSLASKPPVALPASYIDGMVASDTGWIIATLDAVYTYDAARESLTALRREAMSFIATESYIVLYSQTEEGLDRVEYADVP